MIPDMIILDSDDLHLVPASSGSVEQVVHHFQSIAGCIEIWKDPFYTHKQRCPPTEAPAYIFPLEKTVYYLTIVFSREKIHSPSFVDGRMNNLLIDDTDTLVQLLQEVSGDKKSSGNYRIVEVKESTTQLGTFLARRFLQYR